MKRTLVVLLVIAAIAVGGFFAWKWYSGLKSFEQPAVFAFGDIEFGYIVSGEEVSQLGWDLYGQLEITDDGLILLQSDGMIVNVISGEPVLNEKRNDLRDFCVVGEGIVAVCGEWLCAYEDGVLEPSVKLPSDRMHVAGAGVSDAFYVYENTDNGADIYSYVAGGSYGKLVHVEQPILAITGSEGRLFFSVAAKIYTWKQGEEVSTVMDLGEALSEQSPPPITSLAVDPDSGYLFFASGENVFALVKGNPILLMAGVTGDLQFSHELLFVKDRVQKAIFEVRGIPAALASQD